MRYIYIHTLNDQPIDFYTDEDLDEYICEYNVDTSEHMESLDDAINARYMGMFAWLNTLRAAHALASTLMTGSVTATDA